MIIPLTLRHSAMIYVVMQRTPTGSVRIEGEMMMSTHVFSIACMTFNCPEYKVSALSPEVYTAAASYIWVKL